MGILDVGTTTLPGASKPTSWVASNHPDVTTYQCCPGDPPPANQTTICVRAKLDYDYTTDGQCQSEADAEAFCAAYQNNACPAGVYTCEVPD